MRVDVVSYANPSAPAVLGHVALLPDGVVFSDEPGFEAWITSLYVPGDDLEPLTPDDGEKYLSGLSRALSGTATRATLLTDEDEQNELYGGTV